MQVPRPLPTLRTAPQQGGRKAPPPTPPSERTCSQRHSRRVPRARPSVAPQPSSGSTRARETHLHFACGPCGRISPLQRDTVDTRSSRAVLTRGDLSHHHTQELRGPGSAPAKPDGIPGEAVVPQSSSAVSEGGHHGPTRPRRPNPVVVLGWGLPERWGMRGRGSQGHACSQGSLKQARDSSTSRPAGLPEMLGAEEGMCTGRAGPWALGPLPATLLCPAGALAYQYTSVAHTP